jgi:hypothetical protein
LPSAEADTVLAIDLKARRNKLGPGGVAVPTPVTSAAVLSSDACQMHKLVNAMYATMKNAPVFECGPIEIEEDGNFYVWVSRLQLRRALLILDSVVKGVEKLGGSFVKGDKFTKSLVVKYPAGTVAFKITERMDHRWTPTRREHYSGGGYFQHHEWKYFPTGKLSFSIVDYYPEGVRKNWKDGKRQRLEDCVPNILECLQQYPTLASQQREQRDLEIDERNRRWHEEYLRRTE